MRDPNELTSAPVVANSLTANYSHERDHSPGSDGDLLVYLRIIADQRWTVICSIVVALLAATLISLRQQPKYEAVTTVLIEPTAPRVLANIAEVKDLGSAHDSRSYYQTQYYILSSASLLGEVMHRAHLPGIAEAEQIAWLKKRLTIEPVKDSELVRIQVLDADSKRAAMLANLLADIYIEQNVSHKLEATKSAVSWLEVQLEDLKSKLHESEVALNGFRRANDILTVSIEDRQGMVAQQLEALGKALNETRIKRLGLEAAREGGAGRSDTIDDVDAPSIVTSSAIQSLLDKRSEAKQELAELSGRYLPGHPTYERVQSRLTAINQAIGERSSEINQGMQDELASTRRLEASLTSAVAEMKRKALDLNQKAVDYNRIDREYETNKGLHDMVLTRLKETNLTGLLETNNVRTLDRAVPPEWPVSPNIPLNLGIGGLLGLVIGILVAVAMVRLDDRVRSQQDVEEMAYGLSFLGTIPTTRPTAKGPDRGRFGRRKFEPDLRTDVDLFVHHNPSSIVAEYCRSIRSNLLFMSPDQPMRSIVVSSAEESAGKSSTAIKLATLLSQTEGKTLVIDADMRKPRLHQVFKINNDNGLSGVITGSCTLAAAVKATDIPDVDILPSGRLPPNPAELLHSRRFMDLVLDLKQHYRFVVFDSPPLLNVTDAMVLGKASDGIVLVARAGHTSRQGLKHAVEQLADVHARVFGVILNDFDLERRTPYYYREAGHYVRQYGTD